MAQERARPVFIVSGGAGALGKHLVRVLLAQFPLDKSDVILMPQVRTHDQLADAIGQAAARNGFIIHTMVDPHLREALRRMAAERGIPEVDTVGEALERLAAAYGHRPLGQPGLSHGEEEAYMERIKAIEYTVDHDDGRSPSELRDAQVVLTGVSRVGKTPLSIYLSVLGWKVANVPLVPGIEPPQELFEIDARRVVGLTIDVATLADHRRWRQRKLAGAPGPAYAQLEQMEDELAMAKRVFRRGGFAVVDVSNKPVEESADEIIGLVTRSLEHRVKLPPVRPRDEP